MMQVGRNLTDPLDGFLRGKQFLILDRDQKFTTEFRDELVHLRHRGHSRSYWQAVGRVMPDYERRREELRQCGTGLAW